MIGLRKILAGSRTGRTNTTRSTSSSGMRELSVEEQKAVSGGKKQAHPG